MRTINNSEAKCFRECQRKHLYAYRMGRRPRIDAPPLRFGKLFHAGQEAYWKGAFDLDAAIEAIMSSDADDFDKASAVALMTGYDARWGEENLEVLAVEQTFTVPLINPVTNRTSRTFMVQGTIDALCCDRDTGRVLVVEHKTTGDDLELGSTYWQRLKLDSQVSTYVSGAASLGHAIDGCLYDVIGKPTLRPRLATPIEKRRYRKKDGALDARQRDSDEAPGEFMRRILSDIEESPDLYYQRGVVVRLEEESREAAADLWMTTHAIRESTHLQMFPRNPDACFRWGRACEYFSVCVGEADISDPILFNTVETSAA
jgi:hypothetical protein